MSHCSHYTLPHSLAIVADVLNTYKKISAASKVEVGYCHYQICICTLFYAGYSLCLPLGGTLIKRSVHQSARGVNIMMFDHAECADKCLG